MSSLEWGDEPLVLLPGMNCSASLWSRLRLPDLVWHAELAETSLDSQVDRLLDELPDRFSLAGLSLGGIVAMALVRRAPERVCRLALLSTNPRRPSPRQLTGWRAQRALLRGGVTPRQLQQSWLPSLLTEPTRRARPDLVQTALAMADEVGAQALDAQLQMQASRRDERGGLTSVGCPTMIIAGERDELCGVDRHREMHSLIPNSELVVLEGVAHLSPLEAPEPVTDSLQCWLGSAVG